VRPRLEELGVPELPSRGDLLDVATEIARLGPDVEPDPGQVLWEFLVERFERYGSSIGDLASIPWLLATPGRTRTKPRQCYDPNLRFASMLFAVPIGIATPRRELREALHLRANLRPEDYDALAHRSAERGERLPDEYFRRADELCRGGDAGSRRLAELRTLPIVHLRSGSDVAVVAPNTLVAPNQAAVWGHLRQLVPSQLAPYSSLLRCWGIDDSSHIIWSDHVEVLQALALQEELSRDDLRLARARVSSLTACNLDDHQFETLRQHCPLLTTLGLRPFADVLRADLPPPVVHRLGKLLAIAEENLDTTDFLDQLGPQSLRAAVTLDPLPEGERDDPHWPAILRRQSANVLRFLKASGARLDRGLLQAWPPIVRGVSSLAVRASYDGRVLDEWTTEAHLSEDEHGLVLFVAAESLDAKALAC